MVVWAFGILDEIGNRGAGLGRLSGAALAEVVVRDEVGLGGVVLRGLIEVLR